MILTTVKTGAGDPVHDPDPDPDPLHHHHAASGAVATTILEDVDGLLHMLDHRLLLLDKGHHPTTPLEDGITTDAAPQPILFHPGPSQDPRLPLDPTHALRLHQGIAKRRDVGIDSHLPTEVTGAVEELGTNDHLLTQGHMLMYTRPDVRQVVPAVAAVAGIVVGAAELAIAA